MKIENILLGPQDLREDRSLDYLKEQGFSNNEAQIIDIFHKSERHGKLFGLTLGLSGVFLIYRGRRFIYPLFSPQLNIWKVSGILGTSMFFGVYFFTYNRQRANTWMSSLYSNNLLIANKQSLIAGFEPFNRKFLNEEVEQMLFNKKLQEYGRKKYIYNSYVHGPNENAHREKHERFNSGKHVLTRELRTKINEANIEKLKNGEKIAMLPFKPADLLSIDGTSLGIMRLNLFKKREII